MMGDQLQSVPDSELFSTSVGTDYKSDEDSDYTDSDVSIQGTCDGYNFSLT